MKTKVLIFIANFCFASCFVCNTSKVPPPDPTFFDFEFGQSVANIVGECFTELANKNNSIMSLLQLWPAFGNVVGKNCIAKGLLDSGRSNASINIAKQIAFIPEIGGDVIGALKFLNEGNAVKDIQQEVENLNETILCALDIHGLDELNKTEHMGEYIKGKLQELKNELETVREDISLRNTETNNQLELYWPILDPDQNSNRITQQRTDELLLFKTIKEPLILLIHSYNNSVNYPLAFNDDFQRHCIEHQPLQILFSLTAYIQEKKQSIDYILEKHGFEDLVSLVYHVLMEVGEMLYNCDLNLTYEEKKIIFKGQAKRISDELLQSGNRHENRNLQ